MFETSTEVKELFLALLAFKAESEGPKKVAKNPHFGSRYADLEEVVATIDAVALKHGLGYTQLPYNEENRVGVTTMVFHVSGQWLRSSYCVPMQKNDAQTAVAAVTYCRRCSLTAAFGLAPEDDDGNTASQKPESKSPERLVGTSATSTGLGGYVEKPHASTHGGHRGKEGEQRPSPTTTTTTTKSNASTQPNTSKSEPNSRRSESTQGSSTVDDSPVEEEQRKAIKGLFGQLKISGPGVASEIKKHTRKAPDDIRFADANKLIAELEKQVRLNKARAAQAAGEDK